MNTKHDQQKERYCIEYFYKNDFEIRRQYHKTMNMAIAIANLLSISGDYTIKSIYSELDK